MEPVQSDVVAPAPAPKRRLFWRLLLALILLLGAVIATLMFPWSKSPAPFNPLVQAKARNGGKPLLVGSTTAATLSHVTEVLLDKRGGYLTNDVLPPGMFMDDVPNWEFGVIEQSRDLALLDAVGRGQGPRRCTTAVFHDQ